MSASFKELSLILEAIKKDPDPFQNKALVTVVDLEGSGYRRVGARMLVGNDGRWTGAISGGCLEGHALRIARQVMRTGEPQLITYDTRTDTAAQDLGASLGCNGVLRVWIEPMTPDLKAFLNLLHTAFQGRERKWIARILEPKSSTWIEDSDLLPWQKEEGLQQIKKEGQTVMAAVEEVIPTIRLLIFGGGYDAEPLTRLANELGWRTTVTDDCAAKALPVRFPRAEQVVHLPREQAVDHLTPDQFTAAVLISHNYKYDLPYIGMLGPVKRFHRMNEEMGGILKGNPAIHAPIGLDIGGQTPFGIAMAIASEIKAVFAGRSAGKLKDRKGAIHPRKLKVS